MGHGFGNLHKIHGIVTYKLSPMEQKAFAGAFSKGIPNMVRRFRSQVFRVVPPFVIGYIVYESVEAKHAQLARKNPADYENEV